MDIRKESGACRGGTPTKAQLEAINTMAKTCLREDEVYVFSLRLCDDQVDRDWERFDPQALPALAKLFLGKSGIVDHRWSASGQLARIFATEVVSENDVSFIKAWAYIRRGGPGDEWIADIEAGIKKEVSVGCAMASRTCSVCGQEYGTCGHEKGQVYEGHTCCAILREPVDAYEFSFVAVPAQPEAGVLKGISRRNVSLKDLADANGAQEEYRILFKLAQLGKEYRRTLENQVVRMCLALELGLDEATLRSAAGKMGHGELQKLSKALEQQMDRQFPVRRQLDTASRQDPVESGYLI